MKIELENVICMFDEQMPSTNKDEGLYWLKTNLSNGFFATLLFSVYESCVAISVYDKFETALMSARFTNCQGISILDQKNMHLEITHADGKKKCFLSLKDNPIVRCIE